MGLETEYAVYVDTHHSNTSPQLASGEIFDALCRQLNKVLPLVPSEHADRKFLANGSSISFEPSVGRNGEIQGLIEGATPECRSPATLIAYQLAQDELFEENIALIPPQGFVRLLKNSADPTGHLYGLQENYEVEIATGWRLWLMRFSLLALLPLVVAYWALSALWLSVVQSTAWCIAKIHWRSASSSSEVVSSPADAVTEEPSAADDNNADASSMASTTRFGGRALRAAVIGLRILHAPLAFFLSSIIRHFVLTSQLDRLGPFFATRIILDGAGHLDAQGKYWLGAKAAACDRWKGLGGYWGGRPVFVFGHWLKTLCAPGSRPWQSIGRLFQSRQRIQIALGDSCMSPMSQYLRSGITCLLLDWVEQTAADPATPRLANAFGSLKSVARDDLLIAKLPDIRGKNWTALEVQNYYLQQVKEFLHKSWQVPAEAWRIVRLWQDALDSLQQSKHDVQARQALLGKVDWLSKLWMLQQVAKDATWGVRKKVDLRFHELSEDGYYRKLIAVAGKYPLISPDKIRQAKRVPPSDTIAAKRGYLIREFSSSGSTVTAGWDFVKMEEGDEITYYDLASDFWNSSNK